MFQVIYIVSGTARVLPQSFLPLQPPPFSQSLPQGFQYLEGRGVAPQQTCDADAFSTNDGPVCLV